MATTEEIRARLEAALAPVRIDIEDQSHIHAGHAGARAGGGTHFELCIVATAFSGLSRVARQRLVYDALAVEMAGDVHALALRTVTPDEDDDG